ncbi:BZ3500_MvSof-1268-A1-R1_Chr3-1g05873 [Microbotryum saponariae]|uniref:BZ3500_MvSof-1268-A1-R1_Chr3-1g05873 protein n=1 Tax=Microbotryum saponariae TaxID=289078 RepID=A0A2X0KYG5_9BASI|nr:BZ3500_MvSof-1268-A1-R1_Chr3-1g05873 [Microbotryum saponariae]SDA05063.1 BZ3501_MvSof-1269-A2-R1_Chr3-1g05543 [Microbotryum saponariae]
MSVDESSGRRDGVRDYLVMTAVSGTSFINSYFSGALTVSLPQVQKDLNIAASALQWPLTLYALVLGSTLLPMGRLADVYGPRLLFLIGRPHRDLFCLPAALYFVVSVAVALSPTMIGFSAFSSMLGICAAANTPSGIGILGRHFEPGPRKNIAFALLGAGQPLGFASGLVVGALLTETKLGWRGQFLGLLGDFELVIRLPADAAVDEPASFYVQAALAALFGVLGFFVIPKIFAMDSGAIPLVTAQSADVTLAATSDAASVASAAESAAPSPPDLSQNRRIDWIGTLLSFAGFVLLTFALADASSEPLGWKTPWLPPLIPISVLLLIAFFYWEVRLQHMIIAFYSSPPEPKLGGKPKRPPPPPILPPGIWTTPHLPAILAVVFFAWGAFNTCTYYVNLVLQLVMEESALKTALFQLPLIVSGIIFNIIPGYAISYIHGNTLIIISMTLGIIAPILLAVVKPDHGYWAAIFPLLALAPATDLSYTVATIAISRSATRSQQATAGALFQVTTRLATSMSLAIISSIATLASDKYLAANPFAGDLSPNTTESPDVLLAGYRIGGWLTFAFAAIALTISLFGLRGMGLVGSKEEKAE